MAASLLATVWPDDLGEPYPARRRPADDRLTVASTELVWLPLGAGGHSVRLNGKIYEAAAAWIERRPRRCLYHSALAVVVPEGRFAIEMAPVRDADGGHRGVVVRRCRRQPVRLARLQIFRYEIRRWRGGVIPDIDEAVGSPRLLSDDLRLARRLLELVPAVPTPVWGRDELGAGEMWNSNSLVSWLSDTGRRRRRLDHAPCRRPRARLARRSDGRQAPVAIATVGGPLRAAL